MIKTITISLFDKFIIHLFYKILYYFNKTWFSKKYLYFKYFGRDVELLFTYTKICHSKRVYGKPQLEKKKITLKDIENGFDIFMNNNDHQNNTSSVKYEMYV